MNAGTPCHPLHILWLTNLAVNPDKKFLSKDTLNNCQPSHGWVVSLSQVIILCQDVNGDGVWDNKDVAVMSLQQDKHIHAATLMMARGGSYTRPTASHLFCVHSTEVWKNNRQQFQLRHIQRQKASGKPQNGCVYVIFCLVYQASKSRSEPAFEFL